MSAVRYKMSVLYFMPENHSLILIITFISVTVTAIIIVAFFITNHSTISTSLNSSRLSAIVVEAENLDKISHISSVKSDLDLMRQRVAVIKERAQEVIFALMTRIEHHKEFLR